MGTSFFDFAERVLIGKEHERIASLDPTMVCTVVFFPIRDILTSLRNRTMGEFHAPPAPPWPAALRPGACCAQVVLAAEHAHARLFAPRRP